MTNLKQEYIQKLMDDTKFIDLSEFLFLLYRLNTPIYIYNEKANAMTSLFPDTIKGKDYYSKVVPEALEEGNDKDVVFNFYLGSWNDDEHSEWVEKDFLGNFAYKNGEWITDNF